MWLPALLAALLLLAVGAAVAAGGNGKPVTSGGRAEVESIGAELEALLRWPGLRDFLVLVTYQESRWKPTACNTSEFGYCAKNSARGLAQGRPSSFLPYELEPAQKKPEVLFDSRVNLACAAWYAYRLRNFGGNRRPTWIALRRGWALPGLTDDWNENESRSQSIRSKWTRDAKALGLPSGLADSPAFGDDFPLWPSNGIAGILAYLGRPVQNGIPSVPGGSP